MSALSMHVHTLESVSLLGLSVPLPGLIARGSLLGLGRSQRMATMLWRYDVIE